MVDCFFLPAINYYDDFPLVVPKVLAAVVDMAVQALGKLTGWRWKGGTKRPRIRKHVQDIGQYCSISKMPVAQGTLVVSNDAKRSEDIRRNDYFGDKKGTTLSSFGPAACGTSWVCGFPTLRQVGLGVSLASSAESQWSGLFVRLVDHAAGTLEFFGAKVPFNLLTVLQKDVCDGQVVVQVKLLAIVAAKTLWGSVLKSRRVVLFVDNDAARYGIMKGHSPLKASAWLLTELARLDMELGCSVFVGRVSSASNLADGPSHLEFWRVAQLAGRKFQHVEAPTMEKELLASGTKLGA